MNLHAQNHTLIGSSDSFQKQVTTWWALKNKIRTRWQMQIHRYPLSPILTMIVTMCQILITLGGNTWHFHQIISLVCVGGKLWGADRGKNSSFHSILLKVKIFIFVIDWSDPVKHKKSPIVIYNSFNCMK